MLTAIKNQVKVLFSQMSRIKCLNLNTKSRHFYIFIHLYSTYPPLLYVDFKYPKSEYLANCKIQISDTNALAPKTFITGI